LKSAAVQDFGILIVGHGSRESQANQEFTDFVNAYKTLNPHLDIRLAYTELAQPDTRTALLAFAPVRKKIIIVPLFLFTSGHVKNDIPLILAELKPRFPTNTFIAT
jgi:sirohydrochlorin ferrochelatase